MSTVQHRLECTECSRSVRRDSLSEAREAWRRHYDETGHYMTWVQPEDPPDNLVTGHVYLAVCPEGDLRRLYQSEEDARERAHRHNEETEHTGARDDSMVWYQTRLQYWLKRPPRVFEFLLILPVALVSAILTIIATRPLHDVTLTTQMITTVAVVMTGLLLALSVIFELAYDRHRIRTLHP
jgi:hypothetical protein